MRQNNSYYTSQTKISRFFEDLDKGKLMGTRCRSCEKIYFPPRAECPICMEENIEWFEISGKAKLITYTVVYTAPERWKDFTPFIVAVGKLKEGPKFIAVLENVDIGDIKIGMELKLVSSDRTEGYPEPRYKYKFEPLF